MPTQLTDPVKEAPATAAVKERKCGGISRELDAWAHGVTIKDVPILKRFQVHSNGKSRINKLNSASQSVSTSV